MVNVVCPGCDGTGAIGDGLYGCGECLTQGHIRVDLNRDGTVPKGLREWVDAEFGDIPDNPLTLRSESYGRP
jgi:DnaJ-class molecular chaperone